MERKETFFEWIFALLVLTVGGLVIAAIGTGFFTVIMGIGKFMEYIATEYREYILFYIPLSIAIISWIYGWLFKKKEE